MFRILTSALVPLLLAVHVAPAQCPPLGLDLTATGGRMGDPFLVTLTGTPSVSGLLGIDATAGPVSTPIGLICLGLSPGTLLSPFTLDLAGNFSLGGIAPAIPYLTGFTAHMQAAAADPFQPNGLALSNGESLTLRPPRLVVADPGMAATPFSSAVPGAFIEYAEGGDLLFRPLYAGPEP